MDTKLVAGRRIGVIGTGYSAITCLRHLCDLAQAEGGANAPSEVVWLTRRPNGAMPYQILEDDPLPQRSELAKFGNHLVELKNKAAADTPWGPKTQFSYIPAMACVDVEMAAPSGPDGVTEPPLRLTLEVGEEEATRSVDLDMLFSLTGFHPDKELWSEIQVHVCYASDGPMKLAASLLAAKVAAEGDPAAAGDCLKQAAPGAETLENPEPDFYVVGMKSYGRNSTFLMRVGYEQVGLLMDKLSDTGAAAAL